MDKRLFLKQLAGVGVLAPFGLTHLGDLFDEKKDIPTEILASDEAFWNKIREHYKLKTDYINLENGYYCFLPQQTLEHYIEHIREVNLQGSWYMRTIQWEMKKKSAQHLAQMAGCNTDELIITRNTTESLDLIISGQHWKEGDEAIMAAQDYGAMLNQFKMVSKRYGVVNKILSIPNHPKSDEEIVNLYESAITNRTKLLMICHMVNITGQILPVKKICDMAHKHGVKVMVDGAHAFGHIEFSIPELNCDYYGTSLHKWLSVPLGAGFLYVKKENIASLYPLFAEEPLESDDIYRLNHTGTHPVHTDLAIINAIEYHKMIGAAKKEARLRYLQYYWTSKVRDKTKVVVNTPVEQHRHCAIGNVGIEGIDPKALSRIMLEKYKIWTVAIDRPNVRGLRITPNVYTTTNELDIFVDALIAVSES